MNKISCIYAILNTVNNKKYVGSTNNFYLCRALHLSHLRRGIHHSKHLQRSYNFYGKSNFKIAIIEKVPERKLWIKEEFYIRKFNALNPKYGYNEDCNERRQGSNNKNSVLNEIQVLEIYQRLQNGERGKSLAFEFGVHETTISLITTGKHWIHVTGGQPLLYRTRVSCKLSVDQVRLIKKILLRQGRSKSVINRIALTFKVSYSTIYDIAIKRTWKNIA